MRVWKSWGGGVTLYHGDCVDVLPSLSGVEACVCDPPYGLSSDGFKDFGKILCSMFFDIVFPDYNEFISSVFYDGELSFPGDRSTLLAFMDRAVWEESRVSVPKGSVDFNNRVVFWDKEVEYGDVSTKIVSDCFLGDEVNSFVGEEGFYFFLNIRPCRNASFGNGAACGVAELGNGFLRVPVVVPLDSFFSGFLRALFPVGSSFLGDVVRLVNGSWCDSDASCFVLTSTGAEIRAMLTFDLARGTVEFGRADSTGEFDFVFEFSCPKFVGARSGTGCLPSVFESVSFGVVGDFTDRAFSLCIHRSILSLIQKKSSGFMSRVWDYGVPSSFVWEKVLSVLKPGAPLLVFGGSRTWHRLACAIEDAGAVLKDSIVAWLFGQGFPKSLDIAKAIDSKLGAERSKIRYPAGAVRNQKSVDGGHGVDGGRPFIVEAQKVGYHETDSCESVTDSAKLFNGYGTGLKPGWESILVAQKSLDGTYAENALKHGVAGLNIDGCRIGQESRQLRDAVSVVTPSLFGAMGGSRSVGMTNQGRWPSNVILQHHPLCEYKGKKKVKGKLAFVDKYDCHSDCIVRGIDKQSGFRVTRPGVRTRKGDAKFTGSVYGSHVVNRPISNALDDSGGASRYFYCTKASTAERTCDGRVDNLHPTVKPLDLMKYLCRLVKPPTGGTVLDPFMGSGTTGLAAVAEGLSFIGIEKEAESFYVAVERLKTVVGGRFLGNPRFYQR